MSASLRLTFLGSSAHPSPGLQIGVATSSLSRLGRSSIPWLSLQIGVAMLATFERPICVFQQAWSLQIFRKSVYWNSFYTSVAMHWYTHFYVHCRCWFTVELNLKPWLGLKFHNYIDDHHVNPDAMILSDIRAIGTPYTVSNQALPFHIGLSNKTRSVSAASKPSATLSLPPRLSMQLNGVKIPALFAGDEGLVLGHPTLCNLNRSLLG